MMKNRLKMTALLVLTLFATMATAQTVNRFHRIFLTVQQGEQINIQLMAVSQNTPVIVKSGNTEVAVTVGTLWTSVQDYIATDSLVIIYGDVYALDCSNNGNKLTALKLDKNMPLRYLYCYGNGLTSLDLSRNSIQTLACFNNNFTTEAFNDLMCSLPDRTSVADADFYPLYYNLDANASAFMAANSQIAKDKNYNVRYWSDGGDTDIPPTSGTYTCPAVNMNKSITLTVRSHKPIKLNLSGKSDNTPVKIVSGVTSTVVNLDGNYYTGVCEYFSESNRMTIYGDVKAFNCSDNGDNVTAIDVSNNTELERLWVSNNKLTSLDVSYTPNLAFLYCYGNNFTTQAFNDLMCSLPITYGDNTRIYPLYQGSDANTSAFMAANSQIAKDKNWKVRCYTGETTVSVEIPPTNGTYVCPTSGIDEVISVALALYPNPVEDYVTIATEEAGKTIAITDLAGRTVMTATTTDSETTLNVSHLPNGTYIVRIGSRVAKIVKN